MKIKCIAPFAQLYNSHLGRRFASDYKTCARCEEFAIEVQVARTRNYSDALPWFFWCSVPFGVHSGSANHDYIGRSAQRSQYGAVGVRSHGARCAVKRSGSIKRSDHAQPNVWPTIGSATRHCVELLEVYRCRVFVQWEQGAQHAPKTTRAHGHKRCGKDSVINRAPWFIHRTVHSHFPRKRPKFTALSTSIPQPFVPSLCLQTGSDIRVADEGGRHRSGLGGPEPVALDAATRLSKKGAPGRGLLIHRHIGQVRERSRKIVRLGDTNTVDTL